MRPSWVENLGHLFYGGIVFGLRCSRRAAQTMYILLSPSPPFCFRFSMPGLYAIAGSDDDELVCMAFVVIWGWELVDT